MKKDKKLGVLAIALQNLKAKKFRTIFMIFFVVLMSATFFFSTFLMNNLKLGIDNTTQRMGADIIVVPQEGTEEIRDSLFAGTPCSLFFNKGAEDVVRDIEGVEKVSPQLYIATLAASCCDAAVQLIAFDPTTDFVVTPWIKDTKDLSLATGEVVVGSKVNADVGKTIKFYGIEFTVAQRLEKTGMGYDNSVFMTFDTAYMLKNSEVAKANLPMDKMQDNISMLMVDTQDNMNKGTLAALQITIQGASKDGEKLRAYTADELMSGIASQVKKLSGYGNILTYLMLISTAIALIIIFGITINERKYEFGILYTLGAKKSQIANIILLEALIISIVGGIIGNIAVWYGIVIFKDIISIALDIPYLDDSLSQVAQVAVTGMAIVILTGVIAAICSVYRISRGETYNLIRESK